jgi:hypothetical protein
MKERGILVVEGLMRHVGATLRVLNAMPGRELEIFTLV